ncbi:hypothetical protein [Actinoplanes sp. NBRC 103695]|uniref:hypothetical protein n=1 Tax=Actinoplanes sp. NBRC 103695 TaxID=3032202 RepID=UPI00249FFF6C|nr:hypothetical protein [Actinoplanes sp. NBRC 103695]GLY95960.1 hypothetical protein Acsp02_32150 [Actinoplanes sp. NBRC 103695]
MTYRVEYNGGDLEVTTLDAALDNAKNAIASDLGPISGWSVEHDESINDWFVQGVINGEPVGPTAVISGPETMVAPVAAPQHPARTIDGWVQCLSFSGPTAVEAFAAATNWLNARASVINVTDVSWSNGRLRVYFTDGS